MTPATGKAGAVTPSGKGVAKAAARAEAEAARARLARWHLTAGTAGALTAVLAATGALLPVLDTPASLVRPDVLATRVVLVAAIVLAVGTIWLFFSEFASAVRPAVGILWVTIPFSVAAVTQSVVLATDVPGISAGAGSVLLWCAAVAAAVTGVLTWFAGSAEREEIDTSEERSTDLAVLVVGGSAPCLRSSAWHFRSSPASMLWATTPLPPPSGNFPGDSTCGDGRCWVRRSSSR